MEASLNIIVNRILTTAAKRRALNIHLTVGAYPALRIDDELVELSDEQIITNDFIKKLAAAWLSEEQQKSSKKKKKLFLSKRSVKIFV